MQIMPYTSLEQAAAIDPAVDEIRDTVKVHSYDSLWRLLLQAHPGFKKTKVHMVGQRDPVQAQLAAKQLCGKVPMQFDYIVKARGDMQHHPLLQRVLCTSFAYTYRYAQLLWNVFLDAGKIEPQAWVKSHTAITHLGYAGLTGGNFGNRQPKSHCQDFVTTARPTVLDGPSV